MFHVEALLRVPKHRWRYRPFMIDPRTRETGEDKQDYCRRRGWGGGWKPGPLKQWKWWPNTASLGMS